MLLERNGPNLLAFYMFRRHRGQCEMVGSFALMRFSRAETMDLTPCAIAKMIVVFDR